MKAKGAIVIAAAACSPSPSSTTQTPATPIAMVGIHVVDASATPEDAGTGLGARCAITVGKLLSGDVFRGVPRSQSRDDAYARLDPQTQRQWDANDHGLRYLSCVYEVTMNGQRFKFQHVPKDDDLTFSSSLDPKECESAQTRADAMTRIRETTHECEDPHRGAYWGFDLVPLSH